MSNYMIILFFYKNININILIKFYIFIKEYIKYFTYILKLAHSLVLMK